MQLTSQQIDSYQKLYKTIFGKSISRQGALEQGLALIQLVSQLRQIDNENRDYYDQQISKMDK